MAFLLSVLYYTFYAGFIVLALIALALISAIIYFRVNHSLRLRQKKEETKAQQVIAFFHPFCDAGGGGEKVLF